MNLKLSGQQTALMLGLSALLVNCGAKITGPGTDTSTDWVVKCQVDSECDPDQLCGCGLCTRECIVDADCAALSPGAVCANSTDACERDQTICVPNTSFSWITAPNPTSSSTPNVCAEFTGGVKQPAPRQTTFQRVEQVGYVNYAPLVDGTGLYWFDQDRALYALALEGVGPVQALIRRELVPAAATPQTLTGPLMSNDLTVFWTEADTPPAGGPPEPSFPGPPSRLYGVAKAGGAPELLYESATQVLRLVGARSDVILLASDYSFEPLLAFSLSDKTLRAIQPELASTFDHASDTDLYWRKATTEANDVFDLYRTGLDGKDAERVATDIRGELRVEGDYVVWQHERLVTEPTLVLDQNFVVQHLGTQCAARQLPGVGESISSFTVDGSHVYWNSYNALGSVDVSLGASQGFSPILRANLNTGELEELIIPGFHAQTTVDHLVAQTDKLLFVYGSAGLVAIDKPVGTGLPECAWGADNLLGMAKVSATQRVDCGGFNALEPERVTDAFNCLEAAPVDLGAQVMINNCVDVDCLDLSIFIHAGTKVGTQEGVSAPQGSFHIVMAETAGQRSVNVERCDSFEQVDGTIRCVRPMAEYTCGTAPADTVQPAAACRGPGHYEAGKEGSYLPCCAGLNEVFQLSASTSNDQPVCVSEPLRVYACVAGSCGDGTCEVGEDKPCGCTADCSNAAWGPALCGELCTTIEVVCGAELDACIAECEQDQRNSASCGQDAEWQALTECCMNATYDAGCDAGFDACQRDKCGHLRPSGAAEGCASGT